MDKEEDKDVNAIGERAAKHTNKRNAVRAFAWATRNNTDEP